MDGAVLASQLAAGFTVSASWGGDMQNTLYQLLTLAQQHDMVWVGLGLAPGNNHSKGSTDDLTRTGASLGVMAQANAAQGNEASAKASSAPPPRSASGSRRLRCAGTGRHHSRRRGRLVVVVSASDAPSACLDEFLWKRRQILRRTQHDGFVNSSC